SAPRARDPPRPARRRHRGDVQDRRWGRDLSPGVGVRALARPPFRGHPMARRLPARALAGWVLRARLAGAIAERGAGGSGLAALSRPPRAARTPGRAPSRAG